MSTQSGTDDQLDTFERQKKQAGQALAKRKEYSSAQVRVYVSKDERKMQLMQAYERGENEDLLDVNDFRMAEEIRGQYEEQGAKETK